VTIFFVPQLISYKNSSMQQFSIQVFLHQNLT